ncbi:oligopeptide transport system permease protein [Aequitasia blattaphilus]|uniref:ABC transporter permease n=1 Tax=Aequitasia blattaphilus TaxID=2949332 RepID=A0ABT1E904_9FIRM|nr:ABC transporter permease [Aequitasia blattaphilus]MCP1102161.1 ABC transporter permease [Aequitasia blattaphilus]MCR8614801.1 ABC transporter permease [Aequitasia blattaphilus]
MKKYIGSRIAIGVVSIFLLVTIAFFLTRMMPGSPLQTGNVSEDVLQEMEQAYGLSKPPMQQYLTYLENLVRGNLGVSYQKPGVKVGEVIARAWPGTVRVGGLALVITIAGGTLMGILAAVSKRRIIKDGMFLFSTLLTAIPSFVIALLLLFFFGIKWKILPAMALAAYPMAVVSRLVENGFYEEMNQEYVRMAQAKGVPKWRVIFIHILKNAFLPALHYLASASALLLTGSFVVEQIFNISGLGREFVFAIENRDYTMILGLTIFMGVIVIGINLLADLLAVLLNPRLRIRGEGEE